MLYIGIDGGNMAISSVFTNNRSQAVRLPAELRLPEDVKKVDVRAQGHERIISPVGQKWDSFFLNSAAVIEDFCSRLEVLPYAAKASQHYGTIRSVLEKNGQTIGVNDLHIAAHARSEGLVLVTNNVREFERVPALQIENWIVV
jgi:virulence-associated protein VagC